MQGRTKIKLNTSLKFIPKSYNFSDIDTRVDSIGTRDKSEYKDLFDVGDKGEISDKIYEDLQYEHLILQVLFNLSMKEKVIFLYTILRDYGIQIDHASFAKTIGYKRENYMWMLGRMKKKVSIIISELA